MEIWHAVPGFEGLYEVSDQGRVRSLDRTVLRHLRNGTVHPKRIAGRVVSSSPHPAGYRVVHLWRDNERFADTVHAVVMAAFIGPRPERADVCHNNGIKADNRLLNLRYDTRASNHADKVAHDTHQRGERNPQAKLSNSDVTTIRRHRRGVPKEALAAEFGLSADHLRKVRAGTVRIYG